MVGILYIPITKFMYYSDSLQVPLVSIYAVLNCVVLRLSCSSEKNTYKKLKEEENLERLGTFYAYFGDVPILRSVL